MSIAPDDRDYGRIAKTIALLDSPSAGERIAALEAASRQLEAQGLKWRDLAAELPGRAEGDPDIKIAAQLMRDGRGVLSRWEQELLLGIARHMLLSEKQKAAINIIRRKVAIAQAGT